MATWWIECKYSGVGESVEGTFDDACRAAQEGCRTDRARWVVWDVDNARAAEVTMRGVEWRSRRYREPCCAVCGAGLGRYWPSVVCSEECLRRGAEG